MGENLGDLCNRLYDLSHEAPEPELFGYMIDTLRMAADEIERRMIESGRITVHPKTISDSARRIARRWLDKPEVLDQLAASLSEEAEDWPTTSLRH